MERHRRSACPIAYSLDVFGDRWTLLILRDMVFGGKKYYREFLESGEGIATNVLADRLERLEEAGLISKRRDPDDGKRNVYTLTEKGLDTLPVMLEIIAWGATYDPASAAPPELAERLKRDREGELAALRKKVIRAMKPEPGPDR
jgi:DNA-binding HxlR family transcriptional regulator